MLGFGKRVYGHPFRNNTEFSGMRRPYRFWGIKVGRQVRVPKYVDVNGDNFFKRQQGYQYFTYAQPLDVADNDLSSLCVNLPPELDVASGTFRFCVDGVNDQLLSWEFPYPVLVHKWYIDMTLSLLHWSYWYSWDGRTWVFIKEEDATQLWRDATLGDTHHTFTSELWT